MRAIVVVTVANLVTSAIGTLIPIYKHLATNLMALGAAFVISVVVEWAVYIPFFLTTTIRRRDLLTLSFLANLASYVMILGVGLAVGFFNPAPPIRR